MKIKAFLKIGIIALVLALLVCTVPISANEPSPENLNVALCNLQFESNVYLLYAVETENTDVKLQVWVDKDYSTENPDVELSPTIETIEGKTYSVFTYSDLAAKQMTDVVYVRAYVGDTYGEVYKYSIQQYAYKVITLAQEPEASADIVKIAPAMKAMLNYGAAMQEYFEYKTDDLANKGISEGYEIVTDGSWYKAAAYAQDDEAKTLKIGDADALRLFASRVNAGNSFAGYTVTLENNIDLENKEWTPIGKSGKPFSGIFDGNEKTVSNLTITGNNDYVGLFGYTTGGEVKNLTLTNAVVSGRIGVGAVAGSPYTSKYTNITVNGDVKIDGYAYVGGVLGRNAYANLTNIIVDANEGSYVRAESEGFRTYVGGVVGFMGEGNITVSNVKSNIDVYGSVCDVGGITGIAHYGHSFINCSSSGNVTITSYSDEGDQLEIGGIAGVWHNENNKTVTFNGCKFTGTLNAFNVEETKYEGTFENDGLVGRKYSSSGTGTLIIN